MSLSKINHREQQDSAKLLDIFPVEVWHLIFAKLKASNDLQSIANTSIFFYRLLYTKRVEFLFPQVWNNFEKTIGRNLKLQNVNDFMNEHRNPKVAAIDRDCSKIFKLRLVCKAWKTVFDNFYQTELLQQRATSLPYGHKAEHSFTIYPPGRNHVTVISKFLNHFEGTHGDKYKNPFWARAIELRYYSHHEGLDNIGNQVIRLLEMYGHHIHKCTLIHLECQPPYFYTMLQSLLLLLPNLKFLQIEYPPGYFVNRPYVNQLTELIESNPLPKLENLQILTVKEAPYPIFNHLIRVNNHVAHLVLRRDYVKWEMFTLFLEHLPYLTHLEIDVHSYKDLKKLAKMPVTSGFQKLNVHLVDVMISPLKIFTVLGSKWGKTLTHFGLNLGERRSGFASIGCRHQDSSAFRLECETLQKKFLPGVTKFEIFTFPKMTVRVPHARVM